MRENIGHVVESFSTHWGWRAGGRFWCCEIRFGFGALRFKSSVRYKEDKKEDNKRLG